MDGGAGGCRACGFSGGEAHGAGAAAGADPSESLSERLERRLRGRHSAEEVRALVADKGRESFMRTKFALWDRLFERNFSRQQLQRPQVLRVLHAPPDVYVARRAVADDRKDVSYFAAVAGELRYMVGITTVRTIHNGGGVLCKSLLISERLDRDSSGASP